MVVGAFPIAKLSVLLVKQISKPIANICKERAKNNPFFRTYVCMPPAQFYNWCEVQTKMWILNLGKPVNIPVLSQEMAIDLGANLLGETVIFVIGAGLLLFEYNRQSKKEAIKEQNREVELHHISSTIIDLYFTVQQQQTQLREMERIIYSISGKKPTVPPPTIKEPPPMPSQPPPTPSQPPPTPPGSPPAPQQMSYVIYSDAPSTPTPYPDKGIILQTLNYIEMDVFSSMFSSSHTTETKSKDEKPVTNNKREPAYLSAALYNIENNFRSLF